MCAAITADMPKKRLNFSKGECWSIRLNVRFATEAPKQKRTFAALSFESAFDSILKAGTA